MKKGKLEPAGQRLQIAPVGNHGGGQGVEASGAQGLEEGLGAMRFAGCHEGHALPAVRLHPAQLDFHAELFGQPGQSGGHRGPVRGRPQPRSLEGHAELAARDLFFERLDIGPPLEEEIGDGGHDPGFVAADDGQSGKLFHGEPIVICILISILILI